MGARSVFKTSTCENLPLCALYLKLIEIVHAEHGRPEFLLGMVQLGASNVHKSRVHTIAAAQSQEWGEGDTGPGISQPETVKQ
eukprot:s1141_g22.t1